VVLAQALPPLGGWLLFVPLVIIYDADRVPAYRAVSLVLLASALVSVTWGSRWLSKFDNGDQRTALAGGVLLGLLSLPVWTWMISFANACTANDSFPIPGLQC
jgi:prepilin signal peptidase PulO-like enzyme (type II secretory pathway)